MGKGLYTNKELVGVLINDLNTVVKEVASGQYIQFCASVTAMAQKLTNLYNTIDDELNGAKKTIEILKEELRMACQDVKDMTPEEFEKQFLKDGDANGEN